MKLCSRLLMIFGRNFCENNKFGHLNPILGKLRIRRDHAWLMAHWKAHGQLSICINLTFFAICYGSRVMRRNVYSSAVFKEGRPLCTQILPVYGRPQSTIGVRKLETLGYPTAKTASLCVFPRLDTIPECDGRADERTDGRICRSIYNACTARCKDQGRGTKTKRCKKWSLAVWRPKPGLEANISVNYKLSWPQKTFNSLQLEQNSWNNFRSFYRPNYLDDACSSKTVSVIKISYFWRIANFL